MRIGMNQSVLLLSFAAIASACGDGTAPGGGGGTTFDSLPGIAILSGIVQSDGTVSDSANVFAGDVDNAFPGRNTRGFLSFDLSAIPAGKTVLTANLKVFQASVSGDPFSSLGSVVVDHLTYGNSLDLADYTGGTLTSGFDTLSIDGVAGSRLISVLQQVKADLAAGRQNTQYRIRFSTQDGDNDGISDAVLFRDEEDFPPPIIIISFSN